MFGIGRNRDPAAIGDRAKALAQSPERTAHNAVFQPRGVQVARAVQGRQHLVAQPPGLGQDGIDGFGRGFGETVGGGHGGQRHDHGPG